MATSAAAPDPRVALVLEHMRLENAYDFDACIATFGRPRYEVMTTGEVHDGHGGVGGFLMENRSAFPDFHFDATRVVPAGEGVLVEGIFTGTQDGSWRGLPATGRKVRVPMAVIFDFEGDTLVCERLYFDLATALRQLGVARDPLTTAGRLETLLLHPLTIAGALVRSLRPNGRARARPSGR